MENQGHSGQEANTISEFGVCLTDRLWSAAPNDPVVRFALVAAGPQAPDDRQVMAECRRLRCKRRRSAVRI